GLVIPEKAEIHRWRWIPAFAGMTTSEHGNELLGFCDTLRAWERVLRVVGILRQPRMTGVKLGMMVAAAYLNGTYDQFKGQIIR
ncbi:hypothetical protein, partial [Endozoicomonas sp. ALB122]|uniref:hypothetical protein n=1 Tax=Endozoicomonas sp. ALB122 TaxID=3403075 RepID=UPI003BB5534C